MQTQKTTLPSGHIKKAAALILADTIPRGKENVFASSYAKEEKVAKKSIEKTLKQFGALG